MSTISQVSFCHNWLIQVTIQWAVNYSVQRIHNLQLYVFHCYCYQTCQRTSHNYWLDWDNWPFLRDRLVFVSSHHSCAFALNAMVLAFCLSCFFAIQIWCLRYITTLRSIPRRFSRIQSTWRWYSPCAKRSVSYSFIVEDVLRWISDNFATIVNRHLRLFNFLDSFLLVFHLKWCGL